MNIWFRILGYIGIPICLNSNTFCKEKQCSALESCEKKLLKRFLREYSSCSWQLVESGIKKLKSC